MTESPGGMRDYGGRISGRKGRCADLLLCGCARRKLAIVLRNGALPGSGKEDIGTHLAAFCRFEFVR